MKDKICVVTGSRAEFGLLKCLLNEIYNEDQFELQLVVTGSHLSNKFGNTVKEIEATKFNIVYKISLNLNDDSSKGISNAMGDALSGFGKAFSELSPDLVVLLGDRYEIFSAAAAATIASIPIAHIHGGEVTEGAFDDALRHSITKMSHFHFVAASDYKKRIIQLGELPDNVFLVGGMGVDAIQHLELMDKSSLQQSMDFKFNKKNLMITFHPETLENNSLKNFEELLSALNELTETGLLISMPNSDPGNQHFIDRILKFSKAKKNVKAFSSLGQLRYFSCMKYVDAVVGNSSSGLLEAPSFGIATINIGSRQDGRLKARSVIDCNPKKEDILESISSLYESRFIESLKDIDNPYGNGGASAKIIKVLKSINFRKIEQKKFNDINY